MQNLEEVSLSLETVIRKVCEIEETENNNGDNFTTEEHFGLECEEKISVKSNEINGGLRKNDIDIVLNQGKSQLHNFKDTISANNGNKSIEKQFSPSERLETTESSSGFEDLSTTKYDDNKCSSQETELKSNETSESKFTITGGKDVKLTEYVVIGKDEHGEEEARILTSTPKHEENESSFRFNPLDNLSDDGDDSSSTDVIEERENGEYLNVTIDEAIEKYEKADGDIETKFKEVSVQTIIDQLLTVQCRCGLLNAKIGDEKNGVSSSQSPPSKKSKMEESLLNESESSKVIDYSQESLKSQQKISSSHPLLGSLLTKDNTEAVIVKNEEGSVCLKKIFPRIRIGLSKRAKPPPLHNKLIY